jgi:hypothetical protein
MPAEPSSLAGLTFDVLPYLRTYRANVMDRESRERSPASFFDLANKRGLLMPAFASVNGKGDSSRVACGPAMPCIHKPYRMKVGARAAGLQMPTRTAVAGGDYRAGIARRPAMLEVDELHRIEVRTRAAGLAMPGCASVASSNDGSSITDRAPML